MIGKRPTCLSTGASSEIGSDVASELAKRGRGVTLVARREVLLKELADEISTRYGGRLTWSYVISPTRRLGSKWPTVSPN
jgi:short-subunit dehydrogenase